MEKSFSLIINQNYRINIVASPENLEELAVGYLLSEGIVNDKNNIKQVQLKGEQIHVDLTKMDADTAFWFEIRSSGCVGTRIQYENLRERIKSNLQVSAKVLCEMLATLLEKSSVWAATGGCHIAGVFSANGTLLHFAEDIGRHNALDKVIGMSARFGEDRNQLILATSGRLAAGMVAKAARAGFPIFLSRAAPFDAGIELAKRVGLTICAFVRGHEMNIYTHSHRVIF